MMLCITLYPRKVLDCYYADELVRAFAVRCLESTTDDELTVFLLPLVQVCITEHDRMPVEYPL